MTSAALTQDSVLEALKAVPAPGADSDIVSQGYVQDLQVDGGVRFSLQFPGPLTPARKACEAACQQALQGLGGEAKVTLASKIPASFVTHGGDGPAPGVKNFVAVGSGKGGVGKSTLSANLACGLARAGARVGLLDVDIYGPSVPLLFGTTRDAFMETMDMLHREGKLPPEGQPQLMPFDRYGVKTMSLGYLVEPEKAAIWRGPMVHGAIQQLIRDVVWGELDYLILDLPPGTGDAQLTLSQTIQMAGAMIVCTPQPVALADARKALQMFNTTKTEVLGIVENMAGPIFGEGGAKDAAEEWSIPYLGSLPLDAEVRHSGDRGQPLLADDEAQGPLVDALWEVVDRLTCVLASKARARPRALPIRRS
jgi:ATP-binding protein involved in chromosome partitioning